VSVVRDVLTRARPVDLGRDVRDEYHWLCNQRRRGVEVEELDQDFETLLSDSDPRVRGAAVCWFGQHRVDGVGPLLLASFRAGQALYEGEPQPWLPGELDQLDWLRIAIAKNALGVPGGLKVTRESVLRPGRGQDVFVALLHAEPVWVRDNLARIAAASPEVIEILFFHLQLRGVALDEVTAQLASRAPGSGEALLRALDSRGLDLEQAVLRLMERVESEPLRRWIEAAVQDPTRREAALALLE